MSDTTLSMIVGDEIKPYWTYRRFTDPLGMAAPMQLAYPLTRAEIDAAQVIYDRMPDWRLADESLLRLHEAMPDNTDVFHVVTKVAVINVLYGTNLYAIIPMAKYIVELMKLRLDGFTLVEAASQLTANGKKRFFRSFASKNPFQNDRSDRIPMRIHPRLRNA